MPQEESPRIPQKYLLVINIPYYETADGPVVDYLWYKDLRLHRTYLDDLRLACPARRDAPPADAANPAQGEDLGRLAFVPLPAPGSSLKAILAAPRTLARLWAAVGEADAVHVGVAGWPYPLGWPAALFARLRGKFLISNVESAPWRVGWQEGASTKARLKERVYERLARFCVDGADLPMFTQEGYRDALLKPGRPGYVNHASWIDGEAILSDEEARVAWDAKPASPARLVYPGRLTEAKGVRVLLEAVRLLAERRVPATIGVMGEGELLDECRRLAASLDGPTTMEIVPPAHYGAPFFEAIRPYHAVLVPILSDEQPRIIYDAYSQGLPVVASDTAGNRSCTAEGRNAWLVPPGDPGALADAIVRVAEDIPGAREKGLEALRYARRNTHLAMHQRRARILKAVLDEGRPLAEAIAREGDGRGGA